MKQAVQVLSQRLSEVLPAMGTTDMDPLILDVDEVANSSGPATSVLPVPSTAVHLHPDVQKKHQRVGLYLQVIGAICLSFMAVLVKYTSRAISVESLVFWRSFLALGVNVTLQHHFGMPYLTIFLDELRSTVQLHSVLTYLVTTLSFHAVAAMPVSDASVVLGSTSVLTCLAGYRLLQLDRHSSHKIAIRATEWILGAMPLLGLLFVQGPLCLLPDAASSAPPPGLAYVGGVTAAMLSGVMWVVMPQLHDISPLPVITHTLVLSSTVSGLKSVIFPEAVVPTDVVSLPRVVTEVVVMAALGSIGQISVTRGCQLYPMEPLPVVPFAAGLVSMLVLDAVVCKEYLPAGPTIAVVVAVGATALLILRKPASDVVQPVVAAPE
ncbi:hypothetical protein H310_06495 [Aphanomyces invadans]|uniref:EamA domain-containing protein n=1 Tax=Aphanomyces invadans TaxID=157072 RepID=A0A024U7W7_9STRA|nr:hypothetical protein H310_06495 [Aphanomyces invadans]ETW01967.1 hypothetical protein H310_06495 [Aphanomyces invadans]|eukprot:XP_008869815.1 hypothetical protein H310_06495 [Aphanomyces invadans]